MCLSKGTTFLFGSSAVNVQQGMFNISKAQTKYFSGNYIFVTLKITLEILKNQQTCDILTTWLPIISVSYKKN